MSRYVAHCCYSGDMLDFNQFFTNGAIIFSQCYENTFTTSFTLIGDVTTSRASPLSLNHKKHYLKFPGSTETALNITIQFNTHVMINPRLWEECKLTPIMSGSFIKWNLETWILDLKDEEELWENSKGIINLMSMQIMFIYDWLARLVVPSAISGKEVVKVFSCHSEGNYYPIGEELLKI